MVKKIFTSVIFLVFSFFYNTVICQKVTRKPIQTIIIDPGHGGPDPGAKGTFSTEAEVSLQVSLKLGKAIENAFPDIKLIYTRTTDIRPGNIINMDEATRYRADLANESNGDLFICIHCNSAGRPGGWYEKRISHYTTATKKVKVKKKWVTKTYQVPVYENYWVENKARGTETFIWALNKNDSKINSVAKKAEEFYGEIDSVTTLALPDPSNPVDKARMLIYAQNYFRKSLLLAELIESGFKSTGRVSRGVKQRNDKGIWVLQATGMPSVLVEIGFISNKEEEQYINSEKGQDEIVSTIFNAFKQYKEKLETKNNAADSDSKMKAF